MDIKIEQKQVIEQLDNMINKGRVPHALIFYGDKTTSKIEVSKLFIKKLYCKYFNTTIDNYELSYKIDNESHPNIRFIRRDTKSSISIDYAREVLNDSVMYSEVEGPSVYVFVDADYFNQNSINSILKFVEEPKDNTYIIFLVDNISNLLPTIISRSVVLNFRPQNKDLIKDKLLNEGYDKELLNVFVEYNSNEDEIKELFNNKDYNEIYNFVVDLINEPFLKRGSLVLALNEFLPSIKDNNLQDFFVSELIMVISDLLKLKRDNHNLIFYPQELRLIELSNLYSEKKLIKYYKDLLELKLYVNQRKQVNFNLYLNNLFLDIELSGKGVN